VPQVIPTVTVAPSPTAVPSQTPLPEVTLLFTGDINLGRCVYTLSQAAGDLALPFRSLAPLLQSADVTIGSLDGTLSDHNPPPPCAEYHRNLMAPSAMVQGLQFAGFDVITVATNHAKDCGLERGCVHESFLDTLKALRAVGIQPVGGGEDLAEALRPAIVSVHGVRFAFLGFSAVNDGIWAEVDTPGTAPFKREAYVGAIRQAQKQADVVIVLPQWGTEFTGQLSWLQVNGAREMAESGATLIVGNNPHHVQGIETLPNGSVVAYALGNFVFDMEWSDGSLYTIQGLMLKATFRGVRLANVEPIPIQIYDNVQPRLAPPLAASQVMQTVADSLKMKPGSGQ
jgi:poly-gamma-glutamate synthesis protein (capsule biosynthesis protein)